MIKTHNPDFASLVHTRLQRQSFMNFIGFEVTNIAEGAIKGQLILRPEHRQHSGFVHGGVSATLADVVMGFASLSLVPQGHQVVTVELRVSYLNPGVGDKILAHGWVLKQGQKLNFCEAELFCIKGDEAPVLIVKASATMATIDPSAEQR
jgi:uncharacterized protein (TIGR00369 family)